MHVVVYILSRNGRYMYYFSAYYAGMIMHI